MNIFKLAVQWYDTKYVIYTSEGIPFFSPFSVVQPTQIFGIFKRQKHKNVTT